MILTEDADSRNYETALSAVGDYLEQKEENSKEEAKRIVGDVIEQMEEASEQTEAYVMEEGQIPRKL